MNARTRITRGHQPKLALLGLLALAGLAGCGGGDDAAQLDQTQGAAAEQGLASEAARVLASEAVASDIGIPDPSSANAGMGAAIDTGAQADLNMVDRDVALASNSAPTPSPETEPSAAPLSLVAPGAESGRSGGDAASAELRTAAALVLSSPVFVKAWSSNFVNGVSDWPFSGSNWGNLNRSYVADPAVSGRAMKVFIAKGSTDPYTMGQLGKPVAGQGMKLKPVGFAATLARLTYKVKLPANFKPALGGKLGPGLCGGACNGGGSIPTGFDGWSARVGFDASASATVYAYLPSSVEWGTEIGKIPLALGVWTTVVQEVKLNTVGLPDGYIRAWVNGRLVIDKGGLLFRKTSALKIDGIYFDTFFGGQSAKYAAPQDTTIEFADVVVERQ